MAGFCEHGDETGDLNILNSWATLNLCTTLRFLGIAKLDFVTPPLCVCVPISELSLYCRFLSKSSF